MIPHSPRRLEGYVDSSSEHVINLQPRSRLSQSLRFLGISEATRLYDDWRPALLRRWTGSIPLAFLASIAAALIALLVVSNGPGLHQSAFIYQTTVAFDGNSLVGLAPYSIVPTIFAVAVKLWWGALEENFKRLQPYVMMARESTKASRGVVLSYINLPQIFALGKALSRGHWLLALVCLGAFWTEICKPIQRILWFHRPNPRTVVTVSMSAIWQKNLEGSRRVQLLSAQLELREIPQIFLLPELGPSPVMDQVPVLSQIFQNPFSSWLYGAVIQTAYNGSQPAWSLNGWSFAQINLSSVSETSMRPNPSMNASQGFGPLSLTKFGQVFSRNINVTTQTSAVRGRIECSPYETLSNSSNWLQMWDLHNTSFWNTSANPEEPARGYELLSVISLAPEMSTTTYASLARLTCCADGTNEDTGLSSIGYWSMNSNGEVEIEESDLGVSTYNFTVKWIVGRPIAQQFLDLQNNSHLIWQEPPLMAALNCQPIIETANASVTIDMVSGAVQDFSIIDGPKVVASAWSDNFEAHNLTDTTSDVSLNVTVR